MHSELKPQSKLLVYDLVKEAGLDTSDWVNFNGRNPASNPKYCYEWAFWDTVKKTVVLCLWHSQMDEDRGVISQVLNYRKVGLETIGVRVKRAQHMDRAIQMAAKFKLPIRVIIVDDSAFPGVVIVGRDGPCNRIQHSPRNFRGFRVILTASNTIHYNHSNG